MFAEGSFENIHVTRLSRTSMSHVCHVSLYTKTLLSSSTGSHEGSHTTCNVHHFVAKYRTDTATRRLISSVREMFDAATHHFSQKTRKKIHTKTHGTSVVRRGSFLIAYFHNHFQCRQHCKFIIVSTISCHFRSPQSVKI
jgi:hypothetical protein